jgi:hypothetical protein
MALKTYYFKVVGFAGTGWHHEGDIIARRDVQVDAAQCDNLLIADCEAAGDFI